MLCDLGEWQTPYHKAHLLCKTHTQSNHPQQDQNKSQCPEFLLHCKVPSFEARRQMLSSHPGSLVCSQLLPISGSLLEAMGHIAAKATWPMERTRTSQGTKCRSQAVNHEQENISLFPMDVISFGCVMDKVLSQNDQSTSPTFAYFGQVHLPTNPVFPQARLTGLFGPAPPPVAILTSVVHVPAFPNSTPNLVPVRVRRAFSSTQLSC